ncbi:MAG: hypothetical protein HY898_14950 [Deltaproteobacteria bacterium]|nr:hypothetical protein [Deltaproteobacteria bacterium]
MMCAARTLQPTDRIENTNRNTLQALVESELGLSLDRGGIASALAAYARKKAHSLGIHDEDELAAVVMSDARAFNELIEAVAVTHTWFFRDLEQLQGAASFLADRAAKTGEPPRVWVPACATGDEAYSLAALAEGARTEAEILGTDINLAALQRAREGVYGAWAVRWVPQRMKSALSPCAGSSYEVVPSLKRSVSFAQHNLLHEPPRSSAADGLWDLIVCRNVLIYLTREHARRVVDNLRQALRIGGALILGASDVVFELPLGLAPASIDHRLVFLRQAGAPPPVAPSTLEILAEEARAPMMDAPKVPARAPLHSGATWRFETREPCAPLQRPTHDAPAVNGDGSMASRQMLAGISRYLDGDVQGAARQLRAALLLEARLWPAAYYLALCYDAMGLGSDARQLYWRVADLIASGAPLPIDAELGFKFLEQEVLRIVRRRVAGT